MTAYIDLDILLYRVLFATAEFDYWYQLRACDNKIESILDDICPDDYQLVLSGPGNFRYKIYPEYKANRKDMKRPEYLHDAKEYFVRYWGAFLSRGIEADDVIATNYLPGDIIVSTDKDFLQLPATIYNPVKEEMFKVEYPMLHFFSQLLTGDTADNIPGCPNPDKSHYKNVPNFTDGTAFALLKGKTPKEQLQIVQQMYQTVCGENWFEVFDRNAKLLWLLRGPNDTYSLHI